VVVVMVTVTVSAQPVCVAAMVVSIRHHGQQGNSCNAQQQHGKLGPARKGLGDVRPAAARRQQKIMACRKCHREQQEPSTHSWILPDPTTSI
jgi:hypothetical protein